MNYQNDKLAGFLLAARQSYQMNNLALAELICRHILNQLQPHPDALLILGLIASRINRPDAAVAYLKQANKLAPSNATVKSNLQSARNQLKIQKKPHPDARSYLVIKAWGCGFWSDVDHVLGQLLLAEMTGRTPIVHWGENSRFTDNAGQDAFSTFFEPVSEVRIDDIRQIKTDYFPPKWCPDNISGGAINQWDGEYSRIAGLYLLGRSEAVVVSDFHTAVHNLMPWIRDDHVMHGQDRETIYRYLFRKYIKLRVPIANKIDSFHKQHLSGKTTIALHVRGSDKLLESSREKLEEREKLCREKLESILADNPDALIFLLTDSEQTLDFYKDRYPESLRYTACARTRGDKGVHFLRHTSRHDIGIEVLMDTYLAARCDYFIGNARSNVSTTVLHMKNWDPAHATLFGKNILDEENFLIHKR